MTPSPTRFPLTLRLLHWLMAICILTMLFIGMGMVSTVSELRTLLIDLHKPLGMLILCLAAIRACIRLVRPAPPLPADLPALQRMAAHLSHLLLYVLMVAQPLVGWAMLSAGGYPVKLFGTLVLPPIAPIGGPLFAFLRQAHIILAMVLFATILAHLGAALFHAWVRRDGVWQAMTLGRSQRRPPTSSIWSSRSAGSS
jgi:cytochrome b561